MKKIKINCISIIIIIIITRLYSNGEDFLLTQLYHLLLLYVRISIEQKINYIIKLIPVIWQSNQCKTILNTFCPLKLYSKWFDIDLIAYFSFDVRQIEIEFSVLCSKKVRITKGRQQIKSTI